MPKKRILEFATFAGMGGTQRELIKWLRCASREKYDISVAVLLARDVLNDEAAQLGLEQTSFNMRCYWDLTAWWKLYQFAKPRQFELMRTYGLKAHIIGRIVGRLLGIPVILTSVQSTDPWRKWYHTVLDHLTSNWTTLYVSNSEAGRLATHQRERIPLDKIITVPIGIDLAQYVPRTVQDQATCEAYRQEFGITPATRALAIVANLRRMKGHQTIVDALPRIIQDIPHVKCLFVGNAFVKEPHYELELRQYVRANHLEHVVIFTGFRQDIPEILPLCDIVLLPSLWEGLPSSIMEAMALKKPVVATPVGGIPEIVEPGNTGILIPPQDPNALAEAILHLLQNPEIAFHMGQSGYERIQNRYTLEVVVQKTEAVYDHLIAMYSNPQ